MIENYLFGPPVPIKSSSIEIKSRQFLPYVNAPGICPPQQWRYDGFAQQNEVKQ
jgi:hypothetical protein